MTKQARSRNRLLSYSLFGESQDLPDVLHCETIAARSVLHEWEFEPHRHARLHQILAVESGMGVARLESGEQALGPRSLVNVPPGEMHGFTFVPGTQGHVVTLAEEMRDELLAQARDLRRVLGRAQVLRADEGIADTVRQIGAEFGSRSLGRALLLRGLCASLLARVARLAEQAVPPDRQHGSSELMRRFESLLEAHFLEHWKVADYARALAVTPTHLSRVTREVSGQSALRLIDARLMREARRNLAYTHLGVATIAYTLGFSDPAYFSRVFTRALGTSPSAFRARARA